MKKIYLLFLILVLLILSGCQFKKTSVSDIKITVDQKTLQEVENGKRNYP